MTATGNECVYCHVYLGGKPEHPCSAFRTEASLTSPKTRTDTTPYRNSADGLNRYRKGIAR